MSRMFLSAMLAAVLVLTLAGSTLAGPAPGGTVTLSGKLEYVTSLSTPHYEVAGYVLTGQDSSALAGLVGQVVVVVGTPVSGPSIYMKNTLAVESVVLSTAKTPPGTDEGKVTIPVIREPVAPAQPAPAVPAEPVPAVPAQPAPAVPAKPQPTIPAPAPLWGTSYSLLFGRVEVSDGAYFLLQDSQAGPVRIRLRSATVDLAALGGQQVGLVASRDPGIEGALRYEVIAVSVLTDDFADKLKLDPIYTAPSRPISIMLKGREVTMDQRPILGNGRTLVPLRAIGEALGARVEWDPATETATVALGAREVKVTVGHSRVIVTEAGKPDLVLGCDIAPVVAGGRTLVPVRVIAESLGLHVTWDDATSTVTLE